MADDDAAAAQMEVQEGASEASQEAEPVAEKPGFQGASATIESVKHPDRNEDAFMVDAANGLVAVADGSAYSEKGALASRIAVAQLEASIWELSLTPEGDEIVVPDLLMAKAKEVMEGISEEIIKTAEGGATTLTFAKIIETPKGHQAVISLVGDSPAFIIRPDGALESVAVETDGWLDDLVERGEISKQHAELIADANNFEDLAGRLVAQGELSAEQGRRLQEMFLKLRDLASQDTQKGGSTFAAEQRAAHIKELAGGDDVLAETAKLITIFENNYGKKQYRNMILQNLASPRKREGAAEARLEVHQAVVDLPPGSALLLASDGIENLTKAEIEAAMMGSGTLQERVDMIRDLAFRRSKISNIDSGSVRNKSDDITLAVLEAPRREGGERPKMNESQRRVLDELESEHRTLLEQKKDEDEVKARTEIARIKKGIEVDFLLKKIAEAGYDDAAIKSFVERSKKMTPEQIAAYEKRMDKGEELESGLTEEELPGGSAGGEEGFGFDDSGGDEFAGEEKTETEEQSKSIWDKIKGIFG